MSCAVCHSVRPGAVRGQQVFGQIGQRRRQMEARRITQTPGEAARNMRRMFATTGYQFTIDVTGHSGSSQRHIRAVINIDPQWSPPKPNAGKLPPLGIFAYYRID